MPGQAEPSFSLTSTYVPTGDRNNLSAFVSVNADPGPDYGKFRVLQLKRSLQINGPVAGAEPARVRRRHRRADQHPQARHDGAVRQPADLPGRRRTALRRAGLRAGRGDARRSRCCARCWSPSATRWPSRTPSTRRWTRCSPTRAATRRGDDGTPTPPPTEPPPDGGTPRPRHRTTRRCAAALADAQDAIAASEAALKAGDFAAYGKAQEDLQAGDRPGHRRASGQRRPSASPSHRRRARRPPRRRPADGGIWRRPRRWRRVGGTTRGGAAR